MLCDSIADAIRETVYCHCGAQLTMANAIIHYETEQEGGKITCWECYQHGLRELNRGGGTPEAYRDCIAQDGRDEARLRAPMTPEALYLLREIHKERETGGLYGMAAPAQRRVAKELLYLRKYRYVYVQSSSGDVLYLATTPLGAALGWELEKSQENN